MAKISLAFKSLPEAELAQFAQKVSERMSSNPIFVTFKDQVDDLKVKLTAYNNAAAAAANGGTDRTIPKNNCLKALSKRLDLLALSVQVFTEGDEEMILAAGYQVIKKTRTAKPKIDVSNLTKPEGLKVLNLEKSGAIVLSWMPTPGVVMYGIEYQEVGSEAWKNGNYSTTPEETILNDFTPGKHLNFRIKGYGETGMESDWTSPVDIWIS